MKKANDPSQKSDEGEAIEQTFLIKVLPINEFTTTEGLIKKLSIMFSSAGLQITAANRID
ncbi:hypothetical protein [uncultured Gimesia sp.]|uniref:hypothetical protein n=1 Tax=uncultured Gimesia sp. TaxID=1678688 RepID=UPI00261AFA31|nr:hypothetical protein [uncultured Gimesia sp.]